MAPAPTSLLPVLGPTHPASSAALNSARYEPWHLEHTGLPVKHQEETGSPCGCPLFQLADPLATAHTIPTSVASASRPPPPPPLLWTTFTCPWGPPTFHQGLQSHRLGEHVTRYDIRNWPELGTAGKLSSPTMAILSPQGVRSPKTKRFLTGLRSGSQHTLHFPCRSQSELISAIHTQGQDVHMPILRGL